MTKRTEETASGTATYIADGFRTYEKTETIHNGRPFRIWLCEELIEGRWEGFIAMEPIEGVAGRRIRLVK